jgi:pimeloyl-ACP methyl ester carboxylesterase
LELSSNKWVVVVAEVTANGVTLLVSEHGSSGDPTVILVHGYPDTQAVWSQVVESLADRFHVVTYDVRGAGGSTRPRPTKAYAMELLAADLRAVIERASPDRPVHLVGHDWGSIQSWGALTGGHLDGRIASLPMAVYVGAAFLCRQDPTLKGVRPRVRDYRRAVRKGIFPSNRFMVAAARAYLRHDYHPSRDCSTQKALDYLATSPAARTAGYS